MTGRSHLLAGLSSVVLTDSILHILSKSFVSNFIHVDFVLNSYHHMFFQGDNLFVTTGWCLISSLLFVLGTLLPDIDTDKSLIRKILHLNRDIGLPANFHRTWTHSFWIVIPLWFLILLFPVCFWFAFGYTFHVFWDCFSFMGVCFFYPFHKYIDYPNGAKVAKGHKLKIYKTGSVSEYVFIIIIFIFSIWLFITEHFGFNIVT